MREHDTLRPFLEDVPVVAILRGLMPAHAAETGQALFDAGIRVMEVPLNVPSALESISILISLFGDSALIGGGTVRSMEDLHSLAEIGGRLAVSPHFDVDLVRGALELGLQPVPGVFTPSEAFAARKAGASALKLFPAEGLSPSVVSAWRSVLPKDEALLLPTGGISARNVGDWWAAGADGFGVGSAVFDPSGDLVETKARVGRFVATLERVRTGQISV